MTVRSLIWFFLVCSFTTLVQVKGIGPSKSNLQKLAKGQYEENIALYRVEFFKRHKKATKAPLAPCTVQMDRTKCLERLLAKRKMAYERTNCLKGYTIQVYMGSSRAAALKAQDLASTFQSTYTPEFHYRQPLYTVRLGFFSDRLEAYFAYLTLVKKMPNAMIRPFMLARETS